MIKKLKYFLRKIIFLSSSPHKKLKNKKETARIILLSDIDHGNLGDHAIIYAMEKMVKQKTKYDDYISIKRADCLFFLNEIAQFVRESDVILIPGGGWIGTLWEQSGELFINILETFHRNKIVVFPQTIYFHENYYGKEQKERLYRALENCYDITLCVRERLSYEFLVKEMPKETSKIRYELVPDVVLSIDDLAQTLSREDKCLCLLRKDKESVSSRRVIDDVIKIIQKNQLDIENADTVLPYHIDPKVRKSSLINLLEKYGKSRLVFTDRLHGMIFSVITSTPCIVMDNSSRKVSGVYEAWLKNNDDILFVDESTPCDCLIQFISRAKQYQNKQYSAIGYIKHFQKLKDLI